MISLLCAYPFRLVQQDEPNFISTDLETALSLPLSEPYLIPLSQVNRWLVEHPGDPEVWNHFLDRLSYEAYRHLEGGLFEYPRLLLTNAILNFWHRIEEAGLDGEYPLDEFWPHLDMLIADRLGCSEFSYLGYMDDQPMSESDGYYLIIIMMSLAAAINAYDGEIYDFFEEFPDMAYQAGTVARDMADKYGHR